jgi:hypothetical protein
MRNGLAAAVAIVLSLGAAEAAAQGITGRPTSQPLHIEIKAAEGAGPATVRFRVSGEPISVGGAQPVIAGTFTTPASIEIPFAKLEVVFVADPNGPEIVLSAKSGSGQPALFTNGHTVRLLRDDRGRVRVGSGN